MRRNIRIQPAATSNALIGSNAPSIDRPMATTGQRPKKAPEVDDIVQEVDDELEKMSKEASLFISGIEREFLPADELKGAQNRLQSKINKPARIVYLNNRNQEDDVVQFSHEAVNSDEKIADKLSEDFQILKKQVDEYRKLYSVTNIRLKESEMKKNELETKLEDLLEENQKLLEQSKNANTNNLSSYVANSRNPAQRNNKLAIDMQKRSEELRKMLLNENDDDQNLVTMSELWTGKDVKKSLQEVFNYYFAPFRKDIQKVQASFGAAVASYFLFYRFLFVQTCLVCGIAALFFILHVLTLLSQSDSISSLVSSPAYLPHVMLYSSYTPSEGFFYILCVLSSLLVALGVVCVKLLEEDRLSKSMAAIEEENEHPYSQNVLCMWDCTNVRKLDVEEAKAHTGNTLLQQLEETHSVGKSRARSQYETFLLYARRMLAFMCYLFVLFVSCALILYVTLSADYIAKGASRVIPGGSNIQSFIAPLLLNIISGVMPEIARRITNFEMWDSSETNTSIMLVRVYLSNLVNVLLLLSSYMVLADPFLLAYDSQLRNSFGLSVSNQYDCRMDQVGDGLFTLLLITWVIEKLSFSLMPYANAFYYKYIERSAVKKLEFSVADMMVKKLTFMGYIFTTFIFAPPSLVFMPPLLYLGFKAEKYVLRVHYTKPQRLFKGARVALVYTVFYLFTFIATAMTLGVYFMTAKTFAKDCDIQDDYVRLCTEGSYDPGTQLCTLDSSSRYYAYYKNTEYPRVVCENSCGAFAKDTSHLTPFHSAVSSVSIVRFVWTLCFHYPYMPWLLLFGLLLTMGRVRNTLEVLRVSAFNKERAYETEIASNEAERRRQEKIIRRLKTIEGDDGDDRKGDKADTGGDAHEE